MTTIEPAGVTEVLAILHHDEAGPPVTEAAAVIARLAGGAVRPVRLAAGLSPQQAARQVMRALHQPRTVSGVLASGELSRPLWQRVAQQSAKPVVLVPAEVIALAWSQRLEPGRALVVRRAVLDAGVPVILVPMPAN